MGQSVFRLALTLTISGAISDKGNHNIRWCLVQYHQTKAIKLVQYLPKAITISDGVWCKVTTISQVISEANTGVISDTRFTVLAIRFQVCEVKPPQR